MRSPIAQARQTGPPATRSNALRAAFAALLACLLLTASFAAAFALDDADPNPQAGIPPPPPAAELEIEPAAAADPLITGAGEPGPAPADSDPAQPESEDQAPAARLADSVPPLTELTDMRLLFGDGSASLSDDVELDLEALAGYLERNADARIQVLAYAPASDSVGSRARRLSLSRALAVRAFLTDKGVESTRIDVRPLGSEVNDGPPDRVDVVPGGR